MFGNQTKSVRLVLVTISVGIVAYLYKTFHYVPIVECPTVNTTLGSVQGYTALSRGGREYFAFLGIPYAEPPVGNLRFEPPQAAKPWKGVRRAVNFGSDCAHMGVIFGFIESYDEDCLFLNVYTPARNLTDITKQFAVMVFFYGGMFMEGRSSIYGPRYFMDEDIVLVTINYRVGALGFLNTGDGLIRGNMGLKDQNAALHWVQQNIKFFGGNAEDVTIFGQSAGSVSVHYHILSPMSNGLFSKAISQSGVALNPWGLTTRPRDQAFRLGSFLNCPNETTEQLVDCLKKAPVQSILSTHSEVLTILRDPISVYTPSIEAVKDSGAFLTDHPLNLLKTGQFNKVTWMAGVTSAEGLIASTMVIRNSSLIQGDLSAWKALAKNGLYYTQENEKLTDEVKQYYFGDAEHIDDLGMEKSFKILTTLFSDRHFLTGFTRSVSLHSAHAPTFAYFYNYTGEFTLTNILLAARGETHVILEVVADYITSWVKRNVLAMDPDDHGVCHTDDLFLLFDVFPPFLSIGGKPHRDYELSKELVKLWVKFAQMKNSEQEMTFRGTKWEPINPNVKVTNINYLLIDNDEVKMTEAPFAHRLKFWSDVENRI